MATGRVEDDVVDTGRPPRRCSCVRQRPVNFRGAAKQQVARPWPCVACRPPSTRQFNWSGELAGASTGSGAGRGDEVHQGLSSILADLRQCCDLEEGLSPRGGRRIEPPQEASSLNTAWPWLWEWGHARNPLFNGDISGENSEDSR
jgi:hypothetical protein